MTSRVRWHEVVPGCSRPIPRSRRTRRSAGWRDLLELVKLRASQINRCAFCIDMHWKDLRAAGESRAAAVWADAWRESPYYTPRERAALEWTEAVTAPDRRLRPGPRVRGRPAALRRAGTGRPHDGRDRDQRLESAERRVPDRGRELHAASVGRATAWCRRSDSHEARCLGGRRRPGRPGGGAVPGAPGPARPDHRPFGRARPKSPARSASSPGPWRSSRWPGRWTSSCRWGTASAASPSTESAAGRSAASPSSGLPSRYPTCMTLPQSETERILADRLDRLGRPRRAADHAPHVRGRAAPTSRPRSGRPAAARNRVTADWLVGADGAHSTVRQTLGMGFSGKTYDLKFLLADLHVESGPCRTTTPTSSPRPKACWRCSRSAAAGTGSWRTTRRGTVRETTTSRRSASGRRSWTGGRACRCGSLDPNWTAYFRVHSRMVEHLRRGRRLPRWATPPTSTAPPWPRG